MELGDVNLPIVIAAIMVIATMLPECVYVLRTQRRFAIAVESTNESL